MSETDETSERLPFDRNYVQEKLLAERTLASMNEELRMMLYAMADTGCGPGELSGLDAELGEINLDAPVPHIVIQKNKHRGLKTKYRAREIPLVGAALYAFQTCPQGFSTYRGKQDTASTTMSKFLRENGLLPSDGHSPYSLRHTFEDRLQAIEAPEKMIAKLMGHKPGRDDYGGGFELEHMQRWLQRIAFKIA